MKRFLIVMALSFLACSMTVYATETSGEETTDDETKEKVLEKLDMGEVDAILKEMFPEENLSFVKMLEELFEGKTTLSLDLVLKLVKSQFFSAFGEQKTSMIQILVLVLIAAIFTNFSNVFQNRQVSEISFYVIYMLLLTIGIGTFRMLVETVGGNLNQLISFMQVLSPVYFLATALATGSVTSIAFYNLILVIILLVEMVILNILVPLVEIYLVVRMMNDLATEDYLSKFADLMETIISWSMKTILAAVIGLNVIQGILSPAIDSLKRSSITKTAESVPLIGDAIGGVAEVFLGTAVVIRNGIGVAGAIICIAISLIPMIQIAIVTLMYKLVAALIQPISDKRIVGVLSSMATGAGMLLRMVFTTGVLFMLTMAVVAAAS